MEQYLERIRELPFVLDLEPHSLAAGDGADARILIRTPNGEAEFLLVEKKSRPTPPVLRRIQHGLELHSEPCIVLTPYVNRQAAADFRQLGLNFMDSVGNCWLEIAGSYLANVEGRRPPQRPPGSRGLGVSGYQVIFGILAAPEILQEHVRHIASEAGVSKTITSDALRRLQGEGIIATTRSGRRVLEPKRLMDRWLEGYASLVRPRTQVGRYRTVHADPPSLEKAVEAVFGPHEAWGLGGTAAAARVDDYYRGQHTVLHLRDWDDDLQRRLRALPADDGPLIIFRTPGAIAYRGLVPQTVHPLLVYSELLASTDPRAHKAAAELRERLLGATE